MGLAWVQNDCKTKWIPNIWKNEEKGRGACKTLAPVDMRYLRVCPGSWGWGAPRTEQEEGRTALPLRKLPPRCGRWGRSPYAQTIAVSDSAQHTGPQALPSAAFKPTSEILTDAASFSEQVNAVPL